MKGGKEAERYKGRGEREGEGRRELTSAREHSIVPSSSSSLRVSVKLSMS